jgi:hypothetical protein
LDYFDQTNDVRVSLRLFTDSQNYRASQREVVPVVLPIIGAVEGLGSCAAVTRNECQPSASHSAICVLRHMVVQSKTILNSVSA